LPAHEAAKRKAYSSPKLVEYGSIAKLTETGGMTTTDIIVVSKRVCL
jgi:hypothetical protein